MMRSIVIFIFMSLIVPAQGDHAENVDIKQIVREQIEKAKQKEFDSLNQVSEKIITETPAEKKEDKSISTTAQFRMKQNTSGMMNFITDNSELVKLIVLGFFSAVVLTYVAVRRAKMNKKPAERNSFKKNIQLVREEKYCALPMHIR